jgi:hypothetical protein
VMEARARNVNANFIAKKSYLFGALLLLLF